MSCRRTLFLAAVAGALGLAACTNPVALAALPSTRALEGGASDSLDAARSLEIAGVYTDAGVRWSIDMQVVRPDTEHVVVKSPNVTLETIVIGGSAYYRGQQFLVQHTGDPNSQSLVRAAGNAWWKATTSGLLELPDFTTGDGFRSTFLGPIASRRVDHLTVDGQAAIDLGGIRADVYIGANPPYPPLRVQLRQGVSVDGLQQADLRFTNFNKDFGITAPQDVIDFSNLSTLPPIYFVVDIDTTRCGSPCALSAHVKNLGGASGAKTPSSVLFTVDDAASGHEVGRCSTQIFPDVGYNATTTAGCTVANLAGQALNAATVTATVDNPGRA